MGYFANGTEGDLYRARYCDRCHHNADCPVLGAHWLYNYDAEDGTPLKIVLDMLIPPLRDAEGNEKAGNAQCRMFVPIGGAAPTSN